jgi:hypothetical protein
VDADKQSAENGRDPSGKFLPGNHSTGGRPRGTRNKATVELRTAILAALAEVGGTAYLAQLARDDPKVFASLLLRLLPAVPADGGEHVVQLVDHDPDI